MNKFLKYDKYLPKCAFCKGEADYKIEDLNKDDKKFNICAECLLTKWIPLIQDIYAVMLKNLAKEKIK